MRSLLLASFAFSVGGVFMKPSAGFTRMLPSVVVVCAFAVGAIFLTRAVSAGNLSTTYVIGLGLETVVATAVGLLVLKERISAVQAIGLVLVVGGIVLLRD